MDGKEEFACNRIPTTPKKTQVGAYPERRPHGGCSRGKLAGDARDILLQIGQVVTVLVLAPLIQGIIVQFEERVQRAQGPGIFQPYRDLWKLFHKEIVVPQTASWLFWAAPIVAFTCMLTVPILIPVLTDFPLPLSDMGDI